MTDEATARTWSAMKADLLREFREPNFEDRVRQKLFALRQTGSYVGFVPKFPGAAAR